LNRELEQAQPSTPTPASRRPEVTGVDDRIELAASLMCGDYRRLGEQIHALDAAGIDRYHLDIMDGHFVPNLGLGAELVEGLRTETDKPFDAHLQVSEPERFIERFARAGCETLIVHQETSHHLRRLMAQIRDAGCAPGIALNPATSLDALPHLLADVSQIIVMTVDAGFAAQPFTWSVLPKMRAVHELIRAHRSAARICADGSINPRTIPDVVGAGSRVLVLGSTGLFGEPDFGAALHASRQLATGALAASEA
jgi:ribulose-phosphate 3-epimerase